MTPDFALALAGNALSSFENFVVVGYPKARISSSLLSLVPESSSFFDSVSVAFCDAQGSKVFWGCGNVIGHFWSVGLDGEAAHWFV